MSLAILQPYRSVVRTTLSWLTSSSTWRWTKTNYAQCLILSRLMAGSFAAPCGTVYVMIVPAPPTNGLVLSGQVVHTGTCDNQPCLVPCLPPMAHANRCVNRWDIGTTLWRTGTGCGRPLPVSSIVMEVFGHTCLLKASHPRLIVTHRLPHPLPVHGGPHPCPTTCNEPPCAH